MKKIGIICEYNPYHGGHEYLLQRAREIGTVICLMSGYFTQRGEAAVLPPSVRAKMAVAGGADLVLELPFPFSASSGEYFARAGVRALARLGADTLMFGSECADTEKLYRAAEKLIAPAFLDFLARESKGRGAVSSLFAYLGEEFSSNDLLALFYIKAILEENLPLEVIAVKREGAGYRDTGVENGFPSATALRQRLDTGADITPLLPQSIRALWREGAEAFGIADIRRLETAVFALLRGYGAQKHLFSGIAEFETGLFDRVLAAAAKTDRYADFFAAITDKSHTDGRIRRFLLYLLSGVRQDDLEASPAYLRVLAANDKGKAFLAQTRKARSIGVVTKPSEIRALGEGASRAWELSEIAAGLYALCLPLRISKEDLRRQEGSALAPQGTKSERA